MTYIFSSPQYLQSVLVCVAPICIKNTFASISLDSPASSRLRAYFKVMRLAYFMKTEHKVHPAAEDQ